MHGECYVRGGVTYSLVARPACTPAYSAIPIARGHNHAESLMSEYHVGDNDETLMVDGKRSGGMAISWPDCACSYPEDSMKRS